mmetsp:Transcript_7812/g.17928  ORF Transcript_7812/g.17928 Transcript_7812/m.17928 type:complete len:391 (-) Transcript_7812:32-1204(-)
MVHPPEERGARGLAVRRVVELARVAVLALAHLDVEGAVGHARLQPPRSSRRHRLRIPCRRTLRIPPRRAVTPHRRHTVGRVRGVKGHPHRLGVSVGRGHELRRRLPCRLLGENVEVVELTHLVLVHLPRAHHGSGAQRDLRSSSPCRHHAAHLGGLVADGHLDGGLRGPDLLLEGVVVLALGAVLAHARLHEEGAVRDPRDDGEPARHGLVAGEDPVVLCGEPPVFRDAVCRRGPWRVVVAAGLPELAAPVRHEVLALLRARPMRVVHRRAARVRGVPREGRRRGSHRGLRSLLPDLGANPRRLARSRIVPVRLPRPLRRELVPAIRKGCCDGLPWRGGCRLDRLRLLCRGTPEGIGRLGHLPLCRLLLAGIRLALLAQLSSRIRHGDGR